MNNDIKISMIGGDARQLAAAERLSEDYGEIKLWGTGSAASEGSRVKVCGSLEDAVAGSNVIVFPLPASTDGVKLNCPHAPGGTAPKLLSILNITDSSVKIIGGKFPPPFLRTASERGFSVHDYFESEAFQIKNAYTTAEAALSIAMNSLDRNLRGAKIAVTGYGRISKHLCSLLICIGSEVTVAARRDSDIAWAQSNGCKTVKLGAPEAVSSLAQGYDIIFNTVPAWLFDRSFLEKADRRTLIIDLASPPGGVDVCAARELNSNVSWALSLPGKYAPASAGELIAECVGSILSLSGREVDGA